MQVTSRTRAETCDVFEVVFYPALAPHGSDDSGGVLRSELVKLRVKEDRFARTATNEWRGFAPQGKGRGTTEPSACDLRIAREETKK